MRFANQRLFLNEDKTTVVLEGDPSARFLLAAGAGDEIPTDYDNVDIPAKYLDKGAAKKTDDDADDEKAAAKPTDKAVTKAANK